MIAVLKARDDVSAIFSPLRTWCLPRSSSYSDLSTGWHTQQLYVSDVLMAPLVLCCDPQEVRGDGVLRTSTRGSNMQASLLYVEGTKQTHVGLLSSVQNDLWLQLLCCPKRLSEENKLSTKAQEWT